jgi:hypothetical protein
MQGRPFARAALATLGLAASACVVANAPPPQRVASAELGKFRSLCMTPLASEVDDPARVASMEGMLEEAVRQRGFIVVAAGDTAAAFDRITREEGGLYDVDTGERRGDFDVVAQRVRVRAGRELSCTAIVRARIVYVVSHWMAQAGMFSEGTASWDGLEVDLGAGRNAGGTIGGLSIHVRILDLSERELYFGAGGIRTTSILEEDFLSMKFTPIDPKELLADPSLDRAAIDRAIRYLNRPPSRTH